MSKEISLKEILKPPFYLNGRYLYVDMKDGTTRCITISQENFSKCDFGEDIYNQIDVFLVAAMNEKWERDFGERKRWITEGDIDDLMIVCPECNEHYFAYGDLSLETWRFCAACGTRLYPPEAEGEKQ